MKVLELFSGTHSVGVVCKEKGYETSWYKNEYLHALNTERFVNYGKK